VENSYAVIGSMCASKRNSTYRRQAIFFKIKKKQIIHFRTEDVGYSYLMN
jgi:hypothetical protein